MVGNNRDLYYKSPAYLHPDGIFLFGGNMSLIHGERGVLNIIHWVLSIEIAKRWPVILGVCQGNVFSILERSGKADSKS